MTRRQPIFAVMALLLLPAWSWAADDQESQPGSQAPDRASRSADIQARTNGDPVLVTAAGTLFGVGRALRLVGVLAQRLAGEGRRVPGPEALAVLGRGRVLQRRDENARRHGHRQRPGDHAGQALLLTSRT